eukprot:TRINITY_DN4031_c0_g1_i2.p1 TRINITY_DN4031_c0_g1~~TRINITY_DN4031_c0_g1_i2.p1  ORF type:complete len:1249 (+),score=206.16 TRINITY_DN4031_c0_g1_i2:77-3823(+)
MGGEQSRQVVTLDTARRRLGYEKIAELEAVHNKRAGGRGRGVGFNGFRDGFLKEVLPAIPDVMSRALFNAADLNESAELSFEEVLCVMSILIAGTTDDRIHLIFCILDDDRDDRVSREDILKLASRSGILIDGGCVPMETLNFEAFQNWAEKYPQNSILLWDWMFPFSTRSRLAQRKPIQSPLVQEDAELAADCQLSRDLAARVQSSFTNMKNNSKTGTVTTACITLPQLRKFLSRGEENGKDAVISLRQIIPLVGIMRYGDQQQQLQLLSDLFETDIDENKQLLSHIIQNPDLVYQLYSYPDTSIEVPPANKKQQLGVVNPVPVLGAFAWCLDVDFGIQPENVTIEDIALGKLNSIDIQPGTSCMILPSDWRSRLGKSPQPFALTRVMNDTDFIVCSPGGWKAVTTWYPDLLFTGFVLTRKVVDGIGLELFPVRILVDGIQMDISTKATPLEILQLVKKDPTKHILYDDRDNTEIDTSDNTATMESMNVEDGHSFSTKPVPKVGEVSSPAYNNGSFCSSFSASFETKLGVGSKVDAHYPVYSGKSSTTVRGVVRSIDTQTEFLTVSLPSKATDVVVPIDWVMHAVDYSHSLAKNPAIGKIGLQNLGNTCYMNAALQCLVNTKLLRDFFLKHNDWVYHLCHRKWGMGGKLAISFAELIELMWIGTTPGQDTYVAPRNLRNIFGVYRPDYATYQQQDAQEFMSLFLSGMSCDLGKLSRNDLIEPAKGEPTPDPPPDDKPQTSEERWSQHLARYDSVITRIFSGQERVVRTCSVCKKLATVFDATSTLSLNLPQKQGIYRLLTVRRPDKPPIQVSVKIQTQPTPDVTIAAPNESEQSDQIRHTLSSELGGLPCEYVYCDVTLTGAATEISSMIPIGCTVVYYVPGYSPENPEVLQIIHRKGTTSEHLTPPTIISLTKVEFVADIESTMQWLVPEYHVSTTDCDAYTPKSPSRNRVKRCPYSLLCVTKDGKSCSTCPWSSGCTGCVNYEGVKADSRIQTIAAEWDTSMLFYYNTSTTVSQSETHQSLSLHEEERNSGVETTLLDCLNTYTAKEELLTHCEHCAKEASKKKRPRNSKQEPPPKVEYTETSQIRVASLHVLPPILTIQLKRFVYELGGVKNSGFVDFPIKDLNFSQWYSGEEKSSDHIYDLYAVVNHSGCYSFGHYYSYILTPAGWHCYDDSVISPINESSIVTSNAYVLMYKKRGVTLRKDVLPTPEQLKLNEPADVIGMKSTSWQRPSGQPGKNRSKCCIM